MQTIKPLSVTNPFETELEKAKRTANSNLSDNMIPTYSYVAKPVASTTASSTTGSPTTPFQSYSGDAGINPIIRQAATTAAGKAGSSIAEYLGADSFDAGLSGSIAGGLASYVLSPGTKNLQGLGGAGASSAASFGMNYLIPGYGTARFASKFGDHVMENMFKDTAIYDIYNATGLNTAVDTFNTAGDMLDSTASSIGEGVTDTALDVGGDLLGVAGGFISSFGFG